MPRMNYDEPMINEDVNNSIVLLVAMWRSDGGAPLVDDDDDDVDVDDDIISPVPYPRVPKHLVAGPLQPDRRTNAQHH